MKMICDLTCLEKLNQKTNNKLKNVDGKEIINIETRFKERFDKLRDPAIINFDKSNQVNKLVRNLSTNQTIKCNIKNESNCCYMSCILQALAYTKFRDVLIQNQYHSDCPIKKINGFCVACDLRTIFLSLSQQYSISIIQFITNIKCNI